MIKVKECVRVKGFLYTEIMQRILRVADATRPKTGANGKPYIVTVTSGCDWARGRKDNSKHPLEQAWDIRINDLKDPEREGRLWIGRMRALLNFDFEKDYDVLIHGKKVGPFDYRHIHAEYDPQE